ncbi:lysozyme inhibitor LprI family protein [Thiocystis violacea]|uniref:lysozyme inhibitor LprI family protein n=1 Tax=Thiocystis violacea TaxID=13725 RepID=UPI0019084543|nr:lysozyme inhibitor LprI family protein [Thiocystis violacea]MBK1718683.1 hypothetical protein [Thiocystis violacea]
MRVHAFAILLASAALSLPAFAARPSFDCGQATHEAEQMICKDAELARLDRELTHLYAQVMDDIPVRDQKELKAEQRGWVKGRNDCWKSSDQRGCIADAYRDRIDELEDR